MKSGKTLSVSSWTLHGLLADRRPPWRRSAGPEKTAFLPPSRTGPGLAQRPTGKACATARPASRSTHRLYHMVLPSGPGSTLRPTNGATAWPLRRWPSGSSPCERCPSTKNWGWKTNHLLRAGLDDHGSGLTVFPMRLARAAVKMAARPAGQHSEFYPHLDGRLPTFPRYALAGSRSHLGRGSWLRRLCPPLCVAPSRGLFARVPNEAIEARRRRRTLDRLICARLTRRLLHPSDYPEAFSAHPLQGPRVLGKTAGLHHRR